MSRITNLIAKKGHYSEEKFGFFVLISDARFNMNFDTLNSEYKRLTGTSRRHKKKIKSGDGNNNFKGKQTMTVSTGVSAEMEVKIKAIVNKYGCTQSQFLRMIIVDALSKTDQEMDELMGFTALKAERMKLTVQMRELESKISEIDSKINSGGNVGIGTD